MPIVSTMILNSLVMTGEKSIEVSTLTTGEQNYHLSRLNSMMDSWSNERLMIYQIQQTSFALTASDGTYTIGNGADFNMTRPIRIIDPCFTRDTDNTDIPLNLIDADTYGRIVDKTLGDVTPNYLFYDAGFSATSTATIRLYPLPDSGLTLFINTLQPLQTFASVSTNLLLPPGYQDAIETNYAVRSALGVVPVTPELMAIARQTKAAIKTTNLTAPIMRLDYGVTGSGGYSILTGP
jgi:predicted secreted protein